MNRTQSGLPLVTAIDDCVRARALRVPLRTPSQLRQLQFHWGKPPPAADPRTRILTKVFQGRKEQGKNRQTGLPPYGVLAGCAIHRGFKTKSNLGVLRLCPHKHLQLVRTEMELVQRAKVTPITAVLSMEINDGKIGGFSQSSKLLQQYHEAILA